MLVFMAGILQERMIEMPTMPTAARSQGPAFLTFRATKCKVTRKRQRNSSVRQKDSWVHPLPDNTTGTDSGKGVGTGTGTGKVMVLSSILCLVLKLTSSRAQCSPALLSLSLTPLAVSPAPC